MIERFSYRPEMMVELRRAAWRRVWFWGLFLLPFWMGVYFLKSEEGWLGVWIAVGATGLAGFFEGLLRRFAWMTGRMAGQVVEWDGKWLRQISADGSVIGEIDLGGPFLVRYAYSVGGNAVYRVIQRPGSRRWVEFSSQITGGERLVRGILKQAEWPPGANSS